MSFQPCVTELKIAVELLLVMNKQKNAIILFDGVCNFCDDPVNFIIENDTAKYFKFAPLQTEIAQQLLSKYNINKVDTDSVILIKDNKAYTHSTAVLKIANKLGGFYSILYNLIIVPKFIRDFFYKTFAKYRYKFFGKKDSCMIPTPEIRERFLN